MSSLIGLKKSYLFFGKGTDFGHFWLPRSNFKVDFLTVEPKIQKILSRFLGESSQEHCVDIWAFYLQKGADGIAVLQVDIF